MIIETIKLILTLLFIIVVLRAIYIQHRARKYIKKNMDYSLYDKFILNTRELPPDKYLTEKGKVQSKIVTIYAWLGLCLFILLAILNYFISYEFKI